MSSQVTAAKGASIRAGEKRHLSVMIYGLGCYLVFLITFLYLIAFIGNLFVPRSLDAPARVPFAQALVIDVPLIGLFGIQHSVMAREQFKKRWTRIVARSIERSTYVLVTSVVLLLLAWQWQPISGTLWEFGNGPIRLTLQGLSWLGWGIVFLSTLLIDHFDLFGVRQVYRQWQGQAYAGPTFKKPWLYRLVRHPLLLGLLIAFWATPLMTVGHLLFALGMTVYILIGIQFEERDLVRHFGKEYQDYRRQTGMLIPFTGREKSEGTELSSQLDK